MSEARGRPFPPAQKRTITRLTRGGHIRGHEFHVCRCHRLSRTHRSCCCDPGRTQIPSAGSRAGLRKHATICSAFARGVRLTSRGRTASDPLKPARVVQALNAAKADGFLATSRTGLLGRRALRSAIVAYIGPLYQRRRRRSALGYLSLNELEQRRPTAPTGPRPRKRTIFPSPEAGRHRQNVRRASREIR